MNPGHLRTGDLAARQAALVEALVAGGPDPAGFDVARLASTRTALLRKRAGETAKLWPLLAASHGNRWQATFAADPGRAPTSSPSARPAGATTARALPAEGGAPG
jgi:hypothetical protein